MKYVLFILFTTINISAMEGKEEHPRLPQSKHECFLALTKFKAMVRACANRDASLTYDAQDCVRDYYNEFVKECKAEAERNRNYSAHEKK